MNQGDKRCARVVSWTCWSFMKSKISFEIKELK